jgi:hypothetical protein
MNELRDWLKDGDPVVNEPTLSEADAQRMRRLIVAAGESRQSPFVDWARGSWAAATVVIAVTIALSMSRWMQMQPGNRDTAAAAPGIASETATRRQVQLIAPGGTRVIWVFNSDFTP